MPPLEKYEVDEISASILHELAATPYACTSLTDLNDGTANFVFRGILQHPLELASRENEKEPRGESVTSIIIQHSTGFAAVNRDFPLDVSRCDFEALMLTALRGFRSPQTSDHIPITTPRLLHFIPETHTQIHEDIGGTTELQSMLESPTASNHDLLSPSNATSIGRALGSWLHAFHTWGAAPVQKALREKVAENHAMRDMAFRGSYGSFIEVLQQFPDILGTHSETLESVKAWAAEIGKGAGNEGVEGWGVIHGDFWSGNILLRQNQTPSSAPNLTIIDFELSGTAPHGHDLGQLLSDLYERAFFFSLPPSASPSTTSPQTTSSPPLHPALHILAGVLDTYKTPSDDMAFATAINMGVHMICWYNRRSPDWEVSGTKEQQEKWLVMGREFVVRGWKKDRLWFCGEGEGEGALLRRLFER